MAFSEWIIHRSNIQARATIDYKSPIAGGGSLLLEDNGAPNAQIVLMRRNVLEKGFISAKIRMLVRVNEMNGGGCGYVFMLDQEDVSKTSGNFYGLFIGKTRIIGTSEIVLAKFFNGLQNAPDTILYNATYNPIGIFALEVEWKADLGAVGGTSIIIRRSPPSVDTLTFNSLSTVYDSVDTVQPFLSTKGEGLCFHDVFNNTNSFTLDKTSMIKTT